jgi:hypothetical protein
LRWYWSTRSITTARPAVPQVDAALHLATASAGLTGGDLAGAYQLA